jgi:histidine triad (HIT) family protein
MRQAAPLKNEVEQAAPQQRCLSFPISFSRTLLTRTVRALIVRRESHPMKGCPICDLVSWEIPSWIVYRDHEVVCFLPKEVEAYGHTVIAPINHVPDIYAASKETLGMLMAMGQRLALHYRDRIGASGVNLLHASGAVAQQSVAHIHIHLIPRFVDDGLDAWPTFPGTSVGKDELLRRLKIAEQAAPSNGG